jgi:anaerobic selenocysteine-containing dehydrogenase
MIDTAVAQMGIEGGFDALKAVGTVAIFDKPFVPFADGVYPTPSGRIEIASGRAEADGHPRTPTPHADPRPSDGRLRLLSPASVWLMNNSYANDAKAGDTVTLSNETGSLALALEISDIIPRGVALSHKGRWPKREGPRANVNVLNPGIKTDMGESTSVHGIEVTVSRA